MLCVYWLWSTDAQPLPGCECVWAGLAAPLDPLPAVLIWTWRRLAGPRSGAASSGSRCLSSSSCSCWWSSPSCCRWPRRTTALSPTTLLIPSTRCSATLKGRLPCRSATRTLRNLASVGREWTLCAEKKSLFCVCSAENQESHYVKKCCVISRCILV